MYVVICTNDGHHFYTSMYATREIAQQWADLVAPLWTTRSIEYRAH